VSFLAQEGHALAINTPAEFRNDLQQEIAMWQKVIRDNGIKAE